MYNKIKRFKYTLKYPTKSKIIIFDESRSEYLENYVLKDKYYIIYKMRPEVVFLNPLILLFLLYKLRFFNWKRLKYNFFGTLLDYYRYVIFSIISPEVVITFNDNSGAIGRLVNNYRKATFIAIQNGKRNSLLFNKNIKLKHDHYFCFGENDINFFKENGFSAKHYHPVGSFRAGISMEIFDELTKKNIYDICLVSIWRPWINQNLPNYKSSFQDIWDTFNHTNTMMNKFIQSNNLKICVAMRSEHHHDREKQYWQSFFGDRAVLIPNDIINLSSFKAVQQSNLVIGVASTLVLESFGMGKKVLYCDFTDSNKYVDYDSSIVFRKKNYNEFSNRLEKLIKEPNDRYISRNDKYAKYLMNLDIKNPPHIIIRKLIEGSL